MRALFSSVEHTSVEHTSAQLASTVIPDRQSYYFDGHRSHESCCMAPSSNIPAKRVASDKFPEADGWASTADLVKSAPSRYHTYYSSTTAYPQHCRSASTPKRPGRLMLGEVCCLHHWCCS